MVVAQFASAAFSQEVVVVKTVDTLIEEVIDREGDYVNHPADRGGPTRWGITHAVARRHGYLGDMRSFSRSEAARIYKQIYWFAPSLHMIADRAPRLAEELFDTGINMGTGTAAKFLQRALNALNRNGADFTDIPVDGKLGGATLRALDAFRAKRTNAGAEAVLIKAVETLQGAHYIRLAETRPSQEAFLYGWLSARIGNLGGEQA